MYVSQRIKNPQQQMILGKFGFIHRQIFYHKCQWVHTEVTDKHPEKAFFMASGWGGGRAATVGNGTFSPSSPAQENASLLETGQQTVTLQELVKTHFNCGKGTRRKDYIQFMKGSKAISWAKTYNWGWAKHREGLSPKIQSHGACPRMRLNHNHQNVSCKALPSLTIRLKGVTSMIFTKRVLKQQY